MRSLVAVAFALFVAPLAGAGEPFQPDPAAVRRHGPGYRYPQDGWVVVHIEGQPYERGYQHGTLLAPEIGDYVKSLAAQQSKADPANAWKITRTLVSAAFLRKFDREQLDEMKGIADGAADGGAKFDGRPVDLLDVVTANVQMEYETLEHALDALPTGLEGTKFPRPAVKPKPGPAKDHCSAFAATGPATVDGKMVIGHITMSGLANAFGTNVWIDVKPVKGHRIVMQGFPGAIWSAQDYYLNSAGIVLTETTIGQTRFDPDGLPLAARCRRAVQYGGTIDEVVKELTTGNNGLYTNDWLIGDANTDEIATLELGTTTHRLRRSSKNEWVTPGTEGFYWGCNNTKDAGVRADTLPGLLGRPHDLAWVPGDRDRAWLKLYDKHRGKVDVGFGKLAFALAPLAAPHSLDAKVTTSALAKKLASHALFGPPYGRVWELTDREEAKYDDVRSLVPNDWTLLTVAPPAAGESVATYTDKPLEPTHAAHTAPAWHGTLLPAAAEADAWLAAGFAAYEPVVALETALRAKSADGLSKEDRAAVALALFKHRAGYLAAKALEPAWRKSGSASASPLTVELDGARRHAEQVGYGVLALDGLRAHVGAEKFAKALDEFGRANAGKAVTVAGFAEAVGKATGKDAAAFLAGFAPPKLDGRPVSVTGWGRDPEETVIVYGTKCDVVGNKAAAEALQVAVRLNCNNVLVPVVADADATDEALAGRHVLLVGRPAANAATARFAAALPVTFGPASATVNGTVYAHPRTAVVAAGVNPLDARYSVVAVAGFSADATYFAAKHFTDSPTAEVVIVPRGGSPVPVAVAPPTAKPEPAE